MNRNRRENACRRLIKGKDTLREKLWEHIFGNEQQMRASLPSRFLAEIPSQLVETARGSMSEIGESRRYEPDPEYSYSSEEFLRRVRGNPYPAAKTSARRPAPSSNFSRPAFKRGGSADPLLGQKVRHAEYGNPDGVEHRQLRASNGIVCAANPF